MSAASAWGEERRESLFNGDQILAGQDEKRHGWAEIIMTLRPFKDCENGAGEMAWWLTAGTAPAKDLSSIPSIHVGQLPKVKTLATGTLDTSGICMSLDIDLSTCT